MYHRARRRSELYASLARGFDYPQESLVSGWSANPLAQALQNAAEELNIPSLKAEAEELRESLREIPGVSPRAKLLSLEREYTRMFVGAVHPLIYPYESAFRSSSGQVMGEYAVEVRRKYAQEGLTISSSFKDLPDHITVELEFLAFLCAREARRGEEMDFDQVQQYRRKELSFLLHHLGVWAPQFCRALLQLTASPFYLCLATVMLHFLSWEQRQLVPRSISPQSGSNRIEKERPESEKEVETDVPSKLASCLSCGQPLVSQADLERVLIALTPGYGESRLEKAIQLCPRCKARNIALSCSASQRGLKLGKTP
jgi:DMSO reductase family type II enzyme chaperone